LVQGWGIAMTDLDQFIGMFRRYVAEMEACGAFPRIAIYQALCFFKRTAEGDVGDGVRLRLVEIEKMADDMAAEFVAEMRA
jgi:hypothetical protein